jgi:signal transduction histidine kinase
LHFLRIIQEAVTNAIMHAKASEVSVRIHAGDGSDAVLIVEIRDDGEGSPPDVVHAGRGIGNMKSRAKALGAEFRFDRENSGTCIELRVPAPR